MKIISQGWFKLLTTVTINLSVINLGLIPVQSQDLESIFSGQNIPLTLSLKDINSSWRKVSISGQFEMGDLLKSWSNFFDSFLGSESYNHTFYTQGKTINVGNQTYLVAYRIPLQFKPINFADILKLASPTSASCEEGNSPVRLTGNTEISLSLLNLNSAGSFNDLIPVNINQEIAESERSYQNFLRLCKQAKVDQRNQEAQQVIKAISGSQEAYYLENSNFTNDWDELNLGIPQENEFYRYSLETDNNNSVFSYAIPKDNSLNSYVGAVFYDDLSQTTDSITCKSTQPTTQKLSKPNFVDYQFSCPPNSVPVQ